MVLDDGYDEKFTDKVVNFIDSSRILKFYFKNVYVEGIDKVKKYLNKNPTTVLNHNSNHLSLFDFALFQYVMHKEGFRRNRAPRIIAGNNLYSWPFSVLWSKCGGLKFDRGNLKPSYLKKVLENFCEFLTSRQDILVYLQGTRELSGKYNLHTPFLSPIAEVYHQGKVNQSIAVSHVSYDVPVETKESIDITHKLKFLGKFRHAVDLYVFFKRFLLDGPRGDAKLIFDCPENVTDIAGKTKRETKENLANFIIKRNKTLETLIN